ncbi:chorismate-binding protein [Persicobacter diffluens]|uniref:Chorismate-utilising enzyme C-terminal domain-containing protein n=1 Tax=Persicobacter diffluens TaxID=981 RepID=A0AAN5AJS5_9BACT|nr:hypothetical protein PEDI_18810 [Persicobacter diffluens]
MNTPLAQAKIQIEKAIITFENVIKIALKKGYGVACYRLPHQDRFKLMIDTREETHTCGEAIENLPSGFIFNPFENKNAKAAYYLQAHLEMVLGDDEVKANQAEYYPLRDEINQQLSTDNLPSDWQYHQLVGNEQSTMGNREDFIQLVEKGIQQIQDGKMEKFVPSKCKKMALEHFQLMDTLWKLSCKYPNAFVSFVSMSETGSWLGATPEILIHMDREKIFHTVALAGTQAYEENMDLKDVAWKQKEIEEQALVSRYIIGILKKLRIREFIENGPKTARAGNLIHLKTTFEIDTKAINFPDLGGVMIDLLHPTSAVCGMPLKESEQFLLVEEKHDRAFFSGYLGPINTDGESYAFVNLRCMQLLKNEAIFYAGAGATIDSNPEKEWQETEMKCNTLLSVLK